MPPDAVRQARSATPRSHHFARWLRQARRAAGLTQTGLAGSLDMSQSQIAKWERGDLVSLTPRQIRELALALGVHAVEVAAAFGYPVHASPVSSSALRAFDEDPLDDPVALADTIARLTSRLHDLMIRERDRRSAERA